jgi:phosphomannomutase
MTGAPAALEARPTAEWIKRKAALEQFFTPELGFGPIMRLNVLDGVRIYFANGDVAHIRPSGNAPQLRIYANSDSQARADQIVALALREPDGIVRQIERALT